MGNSGGEDDSWRRSRAPREDRAGDPGRMAGGRSVRGATRGWEDPGGSRGSSGAGRRNGRDPADAAGYERSSSRRSREEYGAGPSRSPRGGRDDVDPASRGRPRPAGPPGASSGRNRAPGRGATWDDGSGLRPRRPPAGDPRYARDPRLAARAGLGDARGMRRPSDDEDDEEEIGLTFGKAVLIVLMMLAIGAGAGFAYFKATTPKVQAPNNDAATPAATTTTPASPTAPAATTTPKALVPAPAGQADAYIIVSGAAS